MINYSRNVNACDIEKQAMVMCVVLTTEENYKLVYEPVVRAEKWAHAILYNNKNKEIAKEIKSGWKQQVSLFITQGIEAVTDSDFKEILAADIPYEEKLNVAMSVARWPEFYLFSDKELRQISEEMEDHLDEINAVTYYKSNGERICPYDPNGYFSDLNWKKTLLAQEPNVIEFLNQHNIKTDIRATDIISTIEEFYNEVVSSKPLDDFDSFERGFVMSVRYIRDHSTNIDEMVQRYKDGNAKACDFGLSESRSPLSNFEPIMSTLHDIGYKSNSCTMVVANLFHPNFPSIGIKKQDGQIDIPGLNAEYFDTAPGLGPAYKIRYVFNTDANIQNLLSGFANIIQLADKYFDPMESYNAQLDRLLEDLPFIVDAFCSDSTGYSDYLGRHIYTILMLFYGLHPRTIRTVLRVLSMPIKVGKMILKVLFGSMQGVKLLVFIMNQANRLIGIIARRLSKSSADCRCNAGDDVECHSNVKEFSEKDIHTELAIFCYFNSPTNTEKTAWLKRDGFFDYCSCYFARIPNAKQGVFSITGLPPKIAGKEIISLTGFSEIFKVLDRSCTMHRSCLESWNILKDLLWKDLQDGCRLKPIDGNHRTLEEKVRLALMYSYDVGGLLDATCVSTETKLNVLRYKMDKILRRFIFDPTGLFVILQKMPEDFKQTELFKALGLVMRQPMKDITEIIRILGSNTDEIRKEDIDWAMGKMNLFERNIVKGETASRNSSTYHRKTATKDVDLLVPLDEVGKFSDTDIVPLPTDLLEASIYIGSVTNETFTDIDNIKNYIDLCLLIKKYPGIVKMYNSGPGAPYYAIDEGDGLRVRLQSNPHSYYQKGITFKWPEDIQNPEIKKLYNLLLSTRSIYIYREIVTILDSSLEETLSYMVRFHTGKILDREIDHLVDTLSRGLINQI